MFSITAPIIVLYARGYRFSLKQGVFVYSGTIIFKSNPATVNMELNNQLIESKRLNRINNSFNISGLIPDDYDIRISADGFQTWSKKADIHSGLASEFWNVILARNSYEKTDNQAFGAGKFFISPKNNFIAYVTDSETGISVNLLNIRNETTEKTFNFAGSKFIDDFKKENIEWSPEESFLSLPVKSNSETAENAADYFIVDLDSDSYFNLNSFLKRDGIANVRWDPKEKGSLFFLSQNNLYRVNITDQNSISEIASDVTSYDLSESGVYYSQLPNNLVYKRSLDGQSDPVQITNEFFNDDNQSIEKIIIYDDSRMALMSENKRLYIFNKGEQGTYFKKLGDHVEGVQFSNDGKKLLFWCPDRISVYFTRNWNVQPIRSEDETQMITRYSEPISNIQWFNDYEHIIFSTGRWVKIIELDPRDHRNSMDLTSTILANPHVIYNYSLEKLYFNDIKDQSTSIYSIIFPESTSLFGIAGTGG